MIIRETGRACPVMRLQPGVEATAKNGNITLTGAVNYGTERAAAELTVAGLTGVRNVK